MKRLYQIGNILSLTFALVMNALVGSQYINVPAINQISDKYATLLTPASYAFAIWSLVYTLLIIFTIYQARDLFKSNKANNLPENVGPYFIIANLCNGLWTLVFVKEFMGLSVMVLTLLTVLMYIVLKRLNIANYDAPRRVIACVWWPLMLYTGWVTIATVVNISSWLKAVGFNVSPALAVVILGGLTLALVLLLIKRNVRELLLASAWGIAAIGFNQTNTVVVASAFMAAALLLIACMAHAYRNSISNPFLMGLKR